MNDEQDIFKKFNLQPKHGKWIIQGALEYFQKELERNENETIRHQHFIDVPDKSTTLESYRNRKKIIETLKEYHDQYDNICEFLHWLRDNINTLEIKKIIK